MPFARRKRGGEGLLCEAGNGPGEMADADFGYVGGAPGKINLYAGKTP
jgi:4-hydroxy-3-methylbut-2-en-1-yl diphosphate synthase IspG/GcpE